jgi:hypothetical protein
MLDDFVLKNFRPLIATPCFSGNICVNYVHSIVNFQRECAKASLGLDFHFNPGDSLITRARNDSVAHFLSSTTWTHLFWIDADIGFSPEAAFRLLLSDHDIAAGVYPLKREDLHQRYPVNAGRVGEDVDLIVDTDGFMKVREAPTGFMVIKRRVFDRLIASYPELKYQPDWPDGTYPTGGVHYRFFDAMVDPESGRYLSEDYGFCRLWEKIGGEIYVDANSDLMHEGRRVWRGDFAAALGTACQFAVGAPKGQRIRVIGVENLKKKPLSERGSGTH